MKLKLLPLTVAVAISMLASKAEAASIVFDLNFAYTSDATPNSTPPWLTFTFRDAADCSPGPCGADTVQLLMASSLESASEFFNQTNFNSSSPLTGVAFTSGTGTLTAPTIGQYSSNGYNAGASQVFDVQVTFETATAGQFDAFDLSLIHISEPTRQEAISYAVFCL